MAPPERTFGTSSESAPIATEGYDVAEGIGDGRKFTERRVPWPIMNEKSFRNAQDMTRLEPRKLERAEEVTSSSEPFVWHGLAGEPDPRTVVLDAVAEHFMSRAHPGWRLLEVGGGHCELANRVGLRVGANRITVMNKSAEVLQRALECGLNAHQGDVPRLPCSDNNFDIIVSLWSLDHVADLTAALTEIHRVLRPGGRFLAVASSDTHLADLMGHADGVAMERLTSENGVGELEKHFTRITRTKLQTRAVFTAWQQAHDYLARVDADLAAGLPPFDGALELVGESTLFTCSSTNHPVPAVGENSRRRPVSRPMRKPTGINHPGLTPPGLPPPGARPADSGMDLLGMAGPEER